ncbi:MAG: cytochrome P450 [Paracoccaceae bacterium]
MSTSIDATLFDPFNPEFVQDPYPVYQILRDHDPVHRTAFGAWVLTRHEQIVAALKDPRLSNAPAPYAVVNRRNRERYTAADVANTIIPFLDPPEHTAPRRLIANEFHAHLKDREGMIEGIADDLLTGLRGTPEIEFLRDFATPFSVAAISRFMGYPEQDADLLKGWSNWFFYLFTAIPSAEVLQGVNRALTEFREYSRQIVEQRRRTPEDDLISRLLHARREGYALSERELIDNCMLICADGIENVESGLATAVATFLQHPDQLDRMMRHPELMENAVEEVIRHQPPAQFIGRIALDQIEIGGKTIRPRDVVLLVLASASRDPRAFPDPDRFDIEREDLRHLSFGRGRHSCIGGGLAAKEFQIALRAIFDGSRGISLKQPEITWIARMGHRWPESLNLILADTDPAAAAPGPSRTAPGVRPS